MTKQNARQQLLRPTTAVFLLFILCALSAAPSRAQGAAQSDGQPPTASEVRVPVGTEVVVRVPSELIGGALLEGESLKFEVKDDVIVEGRVVIRKGAPVVARVVKARPPKQLGRGGKLEITVEQTTTADGQWVTLAGGVRKKGRTRYGEVIGLSALTGPLVLGGLLEGKNAKLPAGTEFKVLTAEAKTVTFKP